MTDRHPQKYAVGLTNKVMTSDEMGHPQRSLLAAPPADCPKPRNVRTAQVVYVHFNLRLLEQPSEAKGWHYGWIALSEGLAFGLVACPRESGYKKKTGNESLGAVLSAPL